VLQIWFPPAEGRLFLVEQLGSVSVFTTDLHASVLCLAKSLVYEFLTLSFNTVH